MPLARGGAVVAQGLAAPLKVLTALQMANRTDAFAEFEVEEGGEGTAPPAAPPATSEVDGLPQLPEGLEIEVESPELASPPVAPSPGLNPGGRFDGPANDVAAAPPMACATAPAPAGDSSGGGRAAAACRRPCLWKRIATASSAS